MTGMRQIRWAIVALVGAGILAGVGSAQPSPQDKPQPPTQEKPQPPTQEKSQPRQKQQQPPSVEEIAKRLPPGIRFVPDIPYRSGNKAWTIDLVMPENREGPPRPALVIVHGGGWRYGDKRGQTAEAMGWAQKGYVAISVGYRLTGEAPFPACVQDVRCAVRWFRAHANEYHVDPDRIGGKGHSAGGHLVNMLGVAGADDELDRDEPYRDQSSLLNAVCAIAGPTDFVNWHRPLDQQQSVNDLLAGPKQSLMERAKKASPITYASAKAPPFLLVHGTEDRTVDVSQAKRFAEALRQAGAKDVKLMIVEGANHTPFGPNTGKAINDFFDRTIGRGAGFQPAGSGAASQPADSSADTQPRPSRTQGVPPGKDTGIAGQRPGGGFAGGLTFERIAERHDANKDGKVTKEEFKGPAQVFERMDTDGDGVLTKKEFDSRSGFGERGASAPRSGPKPQPEPKNQGADAGRSPEARAASTMGTSSEKLKQILKEREGKLKPGDLAPDFKLKRLEGTGEVQLAQVVGKRPVVLIFGSYT